MTTKALFPQADRPWRNRICDGLIFTDRAAGQQLGLIFFFFFLRRSSYFDRNAKPLVVLISNRHANVDGSAAKTQDIVRSCIGRKPVVAFHVFAERLEAGKQVFLALLFVDDIRNSFSIGL